MTQPPNVEYREYDPNYARVFDALLERVASVLPDQQVEHIGSTSVPGLGGRGVVDTILIAPPEEHARAVDVLKTAGFTDFPWGAVRPGLTINLDVNGRAYPVVLYLIATDHEYLSGWRAFTAYMREHPDQVERYAQVKREALAQGASSPWAYQDAKTPYLVELAQQIEARQ